VSSYPKSNAAVRKALELDPTLARAHAILAGNETEYDWDLAGGEAEYRKALALDPNDATVHQFYAFDISQIGGREQEALAEINLAHHLDPRSSVITADVANIDVFARRFDDAIAVCKKLEADDPTFSGTHEVLALSYWGKRVYPQVIEDTPATSFARRFGPDRG
jgi:serine/threonine-protein kinase